MMASVHNLPIMSSHPAALAQLRTHFSTMKSFESDFTDQMDLDDKPIDSRSPSPYLGSALTSSTNDIPGLISTDGWMSAPDSIVQTPNILQAALAPLATPSSCLYSSGSQFRDLLNHVADRLCPYIDSLSTAKPFNPHMTPEQSIDNLRPPPSTPSEPSTVLDRVMSAAMSGYESNSPLHMAYVCSGNVGEAAVGELLSLVLNRYVSIRQHGEGMAAIEDSLIRWMVDLMCLPKSAHGILTSGGSMAILSAVVGARQRFLDQHNNLAKARIYVSDQGHMSLAKAVHLAGLPLSCITAVSSKELAENMAAKIRSDATAGFSPMMIFATAGTTNAGVVEPLQELSMPAKEHNAWLHIDGCYGGFFMLTERGRTTLRGIEQADSISLDPHKSLFMPSGSGVLLVRDAQAFKEYLSPTPRGAYLRDVHTLFDWPEFADLGPELTRESRALKLWLPLHIHGLDRYRDLLDQRLDLAQYLADGLGAIPDMEVVRPDLSIVVARLNDPKRSERLLQRLQASEKVLFSSTLWEGRPVLRFCILQWRTSLHHVDIALDAVKDELRWISLEEEAERRCNEED